MVGIGRGGFGNRVASPKISAKEAPDSPEMEACLRVPSTPAPIQHFTSPNQTFRAGRGGWGNNMPVTKMNTMTPTEYLKEVERATAEPSRYSIGRGGRGNLVQKNKKEENNSDNLKPMFSLRSRRSINEEDGLWSRLKVTLSN
ncbi:uncharacterized protein SAPINGB_P004767 [Magnusiomyces paraingens]|uniref:Uncharacterized protein n=1 Tax=Magnusiomyces paraingens TaxID=2606893 RepID=A0A5E8C3V3_9ASCO|nr:uncharacterized protein SAPINGB_P004767 [Saprochaete ingens]VVT55845.1 unnamed protein product [Saprochaete ingens]